MAYTRTLTFFFATPNRDVTVRNRIAVSPMCQYSSEDGFASDWHLVHLGSCAVGGAALVFTEAAAVLPEGRISPDDLGIWKDEQIEMLARIFRFIEAQGAVPAMQLAHAGKANTSAPWLGGDPLATEARGWSPIFGPIPLPFDAFVQATRRAEKAGAKVIEIHSAHGYLLHSFLSPLSNQRSDDYGGSFENRIRFLCETTTGVRQAWPEKYPLFVRISSTDWVDGGWTG